MKKGFTLIELLAVIIILAILMIIAVPNILNTLNKSRDEAFITQAQSLWKAVEQQYLTDAVSGKPTALCYDKSNTDTSVADSISFRVSLNSNTGKVESIEVVDVNAKKYAKSITTLDDIGIEAKGSYSEISCSGAGISLYKDSSGASSPELGNLVPIVYDGTNWKRADLTKKWYDYTSKEWANAVVLSSGVTKNVGDTIAESDIDLWYVWIPRYEYIIPTASIGTTGTPNAITIRFIPSSKTTADSGYKLHPGFKFGSSWKNGIWFAKFESTKGAGNVVQTKANTAPWVDINMYNIDQKARVEMKSTYSTQLNGFDSHASKYLEWTAVSYLTNSIYAKCTSATTCSKVTDTPFVSSYTLQTGGGNYKLHPEYSTTGNIYGVYDMSGGGGEYVMAYLGGNLATSDSGFSTSNLPDSKYLDVFVSSNTTLLNYSAFTSVNGDTSGNGVLVELVSDRTSMVTWYNSDMLFANQSNPWFGFGGYAGYPGYDSRGSGNGMFASSVADGGGVFLGVFRIVLVK